MDDDGDGFSEDGTVGGAEDCDDDDASANPDAAEKCDEVDNDCDGSTDETCVGETTDDDDGDGFCEDDEACTDETVAPGDCDDSTETINPSVVDVCDGVDNNCDGTVDEGCIGDPDVDDDGDGFTENAGDCDDANAEAFPDAEESCSDSVDTDCNGMDDTLDPLCAEDLPGGSGASSGCGCDMTATDGHTNYFELILGLLALASTRILRARKSLGA